jgi:hypothetical protein
MSTADDLTGSPTGRPGLAPAPGGLRFVQDLVNTALAGQSDGARPDGVPGGLWSALFPGQLPAAPIPLLARPVPADGFTVDGHPLVAVEAGHADTDVLHAPSIGLVAAADVVYNNVHQYLAETPGGGLEGWHRALDIVAALRPAHVVAGHKDAARDDGPANIDETRRYLDDTARLLATGPTRTGFFSATLALYPDRVNPFTVWLNATRLLSA